MIFSKFNQVCYLHKNTDISQKTPSCHLALNLCFHPKPWETTNLLSVSTNLPFLDISDIRNHALCTLLHLASFTKDKACSLMLLSAIAYFVYPLTS